MEDQDLMEECEHGNTQDDCEYCDEEDRDSDTGKEIAKGTLD